MRISDWSSDVCSSDLRSFSMRVMVIVKATKNSEAGVMPSEKLLAEMGKFNEELVKAGVMLAGEGLHPSSKGKRVVFSSGKKDRKSVVEGKSVAGRVDLGGRRIIKKKKKKENK